MKSDHCVCVTPVLELNGVEGQRGSSIVKEEILKDRSSNHEALGKSLFQCLTEKVDHRKKYVWRMSSIRNFLFFKL